MDPVLDVYNLKHLYTTLMESNMLDERKLKTFLSYQTSFSQTELMEVCELHSDTIKTFIEDNYKITHPLLQKMCNVNQTQQTTQNSNHVQR